MEDRGECIVQQHDGHDRPRLFALHEPGRLWYFDLCGPHAWPGSDWAAPEVFSQSEAGTIVKEEKAGDERALAVTGYRMHEMRSECCARLAYALGSSDDKFNGSVVIARKRILERDVLVDDPQWPSELPAAFDVVDDATAKMFPRTLDDLRAALEPGVLMWQNVSVFLGPEKSAYKIEQGQEDESWCLRGDGENVRRCLDTMCSSLNIELVVYHEAIALHAPRFA